MNFSHQITENILNIVVDGDLLGQTDEAKIIIFVEKSLEEQKFCIFDVQKVAYMNSSGISLLIRVLNKFRANGGEMVLLNPSDSVSKLLMITKLNQILSVFKNSEEATNFLKKKINS